jgi:hypothetical protein
VYATSNPVFEYLFLPEPTGYNFLYSGTPIVKSIVWGTFQNKARSFDNLVKEKGT